MYKCISVEKAKELIDNAAVAIFDIRDEIAYNTAHINGARHLSKDSFSEICQELNEHQAVLVYCYRGKSSRMIAQILLNQGIRTVYSLEGGFEAWKKNMICT